MSQQQHQGAVPSPRRCKPSGRRARQSISDECRSRAAKPTGGHATPCWLTMQKQQSIAAVRPEPSIESGPETTPLTAPAIRKFTWLVASSMGHPGMYVYNQGSRTCSLNANRHPEPCRLHLNFESNQSHAPTPLGARNKTRPGTHCNESRTRTSSTKSGGESECGPGSRWKSIIAPAGAVSPSGEQRSLCSFHCFADRGTVEQFEMRMLPYPTWHATGR